MKSLRVIKHGDVFQYVLLRFIASLVVLPLHLFLFQATEKAFNDRVIPTIALAAHTAFEPVGLEQSPERFAGILRASIRMMDQTGLRAATPAGHPTFAVSNLPAILTMPDTTTNLDSKILRGPTRD